MTWALEESCPGVYVLLLSKYKVHLRNYLSQWMGSLFMCLQLEGLNTQLDRFYQDNEDALMMKVLHYFFLNSLSKHCLVNVTLCLMKALEREILRQESREGVLDILKRPRSFMDEGIFLSTLWN